jgi:hypothetical protein
MIWNVLNDKSSGNNLHIDFEPINYVASSFFRGLKVESFFLYISDLLENRNFGVENASFLFYHQMDWEDKVEFFNEFGREIKDYELRIRFFDGKANYTVLNSNCFYRIFYDYSKKILEVYQSDTSLPKTWKDEMIIALHKLKLKIDRSNA